MFEKKVYTHNDYTLDYAVDYPKDFDENKTYPIIFYFHGMGGVGKGIEHICNYAPMRREYMPEDTDFIIVAPSCCDYMWFENIKELVGFVNHILANTYVDNSRVYLTGSSMGGYTSWALAILHPELWSAAAICCGGGFYWVAQRITFPVRAFHGTDDTCVLPRESEIMVQRIKERGGDAELILYEGCGHSAWEKAYTDHETFYWLLKHKK